MQELSPACVLIRPEAGAVLAVKRVMNGSSGTPSTVPYGADQALYLIVDRFDGLGSACRETEAERSDLETVITDLMSGQFNDPVRVVAFNTLEHWLQNISEEIALEIQTRCDIDGEDVPEPIRDFVVRYTRPDYDKSLASIERNVSGSLGRARLRVQRFSR